MSKHWCEHGPRTQLIVSTWTVNASLWSIVECVPLLQFPLTRTVWNDLKVRQSGCDSQNSCTLYSIREVNVRKGTIRENREHVSKIWAKRKAGKSMWNLRRSIGRDSTRRWIETKCAYYKTVKGSSQKIGSSIIFLYACVWFVFHYLFSSSSPPPPVHPFETLTAFPLALYVFPPLP